MIDRGVCYHESGHAVVAHVLGLSVEEVSANEHGDTWGHMSGLPVEKTQVARAAVYGTDPELVHRWVLSLAAGPAAKCLWSNGLTRVHPFPWELWGGAGDKAGAERLLGTALGLDVDLGDIVDEAIDFLKEPRIWAAVERVVAELRHFDGELDYELFTGAFMGFAPLEGAEERAAGAPSVGRRSKVIGREEALEKIGKKHPVGAARLAASWRPSAWERT